MKYPNPSLNPKQKITRTKTHGMLFENMINLTNEYYRNHNIALIYKKPTPIQVVRVDYPKRSRARIIEGYYQTASTTDYNGIYRGKYIDYEAKETNNLSFSFKHISLHQIEHLLKVSKHGGIAFVIIYFKKLNEIYLLDILYFYDLYQLSLSGGEKSIKIEKIKQLGHMVKTGYSPTMDYIAVINQVYFKKELLKND